VDAKILEKLVMASLPKLGKHWQRLDMHASVLCTQWFMCLFITTLPSETAFRVWDCLFFQGQDMLFHVAVAILGIFQQELLAARDAGEMAMVLTRCTQTLFDGETLVKGWNMISAKGVKKIAHWRQKYRAQITRQTQALEADTQLEQLLNQLHFSTDELADLQKQYKSLDCVSESGMGYDAFCEVMAVAAPEWNVKADSALIRALFACLDERRTNYITFAQLMRGLSVISRGSYEERLQFAFQIFDLDRDGCVTLGDLSTLVAAIFDLRKQPYFAAEAVVNSLVAFVVDHGLHTQGRLELPHFREFLRLKPAVVEGLTLGHEVDTQLSFGSPLQGSSSSSSSTSSTASLPSLSTAGLATSLHSALPPAPRIAAKTHGRLSLTNFLSFAN
jgi:Ca2+-binding EF-hand superfamily protein